MAALTASAVLATDPMGALSARMEGDARSVKAPARASFEEFLEKDARVPIGGGEFGPYSFEGREVLRIIARRFDRVLGSADGARKPVTDSITTIAGGAQWGKTVLELNLAAYGTALRFFNVGIFLPSDDLVQGIVDTKFRPEIVDQIPWFAEMTQVGKAVNKSGKTANRKGAFLVTDGVRKASGLVLGLQKVPTSYTLDVALKDELDDIPPKNEKFVKGRLTASKLRATANIGTQRVHGRGQHAKWKGSSQGVVLLPSISTNTHTKGAGGNAGQSGQVAGDDTGSPSIVLGERHDSHRGLVVTSNRDVPAPSAGPIDFPVGAEVTTAPLGWLNPEEEFPAVIRLQLGDVPSPSDPRLTWTGDFRHTEMGETIATHKPSHRYYLADPETGAVLDRRHPIAHHRVAAKLEMEDWALRVSQLSIDAIGLSQIVGQFQLAVDDPEEMVVFRCDVLALPQSTAQALTPAIIDRARSLDPYDARLRVEPGRAAFAGLDVGDKCWLWVNEIESPARKRLIYPASIAAADLVPRTIALFHQLGIATLFIDQRPLVSQARELALSLNQLDALSAWPEPDDSQWLNLPGGLAWNPLKKRWTGLRCAVVRFDKKSIGAGIEHGFDVFEEGGITKFVPVIKCNREETIDRAVRSFLTPAEGVNEILPAGGGLRALPSQLLARKAGPIHESVEAHIITGSEREKNADGTLGEYVDGCANHLLLAKGYCDLAENECATSRVSRGPSGYSSISKSRRVGGGRSRTGGML